MACEWCSHAHEHVRTRIGALFCADEKNVVWMQDDGLWASSVTGAQSKLTDAANVTMFQCSPDSKTVVFLSNGCVLCAACRVRIASHVAGQRAVRCGGHRSRRPRQVVARNGSRGAV